MDSGDVVLPYNQSKDLWHLATFGFGIKESAHHLTQKKILFYAVFYFYMVCRREDVWAMLCWRMMDPWGSRTHKATQELQLRWKSRMGLL